MLGLDIGGTKLAAGVVDPAGRVLSQVRIPTPTGWEQALRDLGTAARLALQRAGMDAVDLAAVGVACGGPLDAAAGVVLSPPNLPGWDHVAVGPLLEDAFGRPTFVENDANAAAIASARWGTWAGVEDLVYLTISTGVGAGVITGGQLLTGSDGNGAEVGHIVVSWQGRQCVCGQQGCLEAYVSGRSIARRASERLEAGASSSLWGIGDLTAEDVSRAAAAGDSLALSLWAETTDMLAAAVSSVINLFEPRVVILGGGVTEAGDMLLDPVRTATVRYALSPAGRKAEIAITPYGPAIGIVGAAAVGASAAEHGDLQ